MNHKLSPYVLSSEKREKMRDKREMTIKLSYENNYFLIHVYVLLIPCRLLVVILYCSYFLFSISPKIDKKRKDGTKGGRL